MAAPPDVIQHMADIRAIGAEQRAQSSPSAPAFRAARYTGTPDKYTPSAPGRKLLLLIRHGQGDHNVMQARWRELGLPGEPYTVDNDPGHLALDPALTLLGRRQAAFAAQNTLATLPAPQLVLCSPMRRAVETAMLALGGTAAREAVERDERTRAKEKDAGLALARRAEELRESSQSHAEVCAAVAASKTLPQLVAADYPEIFALLTAFSGSGSAGARFRAADAAHETGGRHTCDRRRSRDEVEAAYGPFMACGAITAEDELWHDTERESSEHIARRARDLLATEVFAANDTIGSADVVAIAAHSELLLTLCNSVLWRDNEQCKIDDAVFSWFATGEVRAVEVWRE